ncbi:hypothetical protein jhhlp_003849 [Lomentospora prolificans]|uniref:Gamma interferon inducible lysosomal thiol reductase GILT n=1 Tax=Lomentospora prolificans TaxID=41688 RepID=A0A2N3N9W5_9PEZI|nr:hypothetical protein jhhlp_003849 [Lomentospora prolificans]
MSFNEKRTLSEPYPQAPPMIRSRAARPLLGLIAIFLVSWYSLWHWDLLEPRSASETLEPGRKHEGDFPISRPARTLVPLEAHIMSKCPDARDCLRDMILPAMQRVHDKVNFTLSFIGTPSSNDGVACRHGPQECMGNILELCAFELYPDPKISLGFTMCITRDYKHIPERSLIQDCALEHAIDFQALNNCASRDDGAHGVDMLRRSVMHSKEVSKS